MQIKPIAWLRSNWLLLVLIVFFSFLFFFRLDWLTLTSWDEGWYASIAREIIRSGDWFHLKWNGLPYYDHPPLGFWLMAVSYMFFGVNELSTRLPSAVLGLGSIIFMYKLGESLFKDKKIGWVAATVLGTCVWYVIRVRSGNLDSIFVFFFILTIYFAQKAAHDFRYFIGVGLSFACLMLSKTLVGVAALPLIFYLVFFQLLKPKKNWAYFLIGTGLFLLVLLPWYLVMKNTYSDFIHHHFFVIGMREKSTASFFRLSNVNQVFFYIHMGVRKWYYPWLVGSIVTLVFTVWRRRREGLFILLWNFLILYPFVTAEKTELWHLIPVYIPLSFIVAYGFYLIFKKAPLMLLLFTLVIVFLQFKTFYHEVIPGARYVPDDVDIALQAARYNKTLFLDDDYVPLAVFYSGKNIRQVAYEPSDKNTLVKLMQSSEKDFIVITRYWAVQNLDKEKIPYTILEKNQSFSIVTKKI